MIKRFILYFFISCFVLFPNLKSPQLNLIDDGHAIKVSANLSREYSVKNWQENLYERSIGRLRPLNYVYFYLIYVTFGASPHALWIAQTVLLALTLFVFSEILLALTDKQSKLATFAPLILLLLPSTLENFYRLGPFEPRQVLFLLLFLWWMIVFVQTNEPKIRQYVLGIFLFALALFTKETSILLLPAFLTVFAAQWFQGQWRERSYSVLLGVLTMMTIGFFLLIPPRTSYTTGYQPSAGKIVHNLFVLRITIPEVFWVWMVILHAAVIRLALTIWERPKSWLETLRKEKWQFVLHVLIAGNVLLLLPWDYQLERYYYVAGVFIVLAAVLEGRAQWQFWHKQQMPLQLEKLVVVALIAGSVLFQTLVVFPPQSYAVFPLLSRALKILPTWFSQYQYSGELTSYLAHSVSPNEKVYFDYNDYEVVYEAGIYASDYGSRSVVVISPNQQAVTDFGSLYGYQKNVAESYLADPSPNKVYVFRAKSSKLLEDKKATMLVPQTSLITIDPKYTWGVIRPE